MHNTISKPMMPSVQSTPVDYRSVVNTDSDISTIKLPYVGMTVYSKSSGDLYIVKATKSSVIGPITVSDYSVDITDKVITYNNIDSILDEKRYITKSQMVEYIDDVLLNGSWG